MGSAGRADQRHLDAFKIETRTVPSTNFVPLGRIKGISTPSRSRPPLLASVLESLAGIKDISTPSRSRRKVGQELALGINLVQRHLDAFKIETSQ